MKIYIAAKFARRFEMSRVLHHLEAAGHEITSRWLQVGTQENKDITDRALMDVEDVKRSDVLVFIGEPQASENRGGGRWWEFGFAYGLGLPTIALVNMDDGNGGHDHLPLGHESVFTGLPDVIAVTSVQGVIEALDEIGEQRG